MTRRELFRRIAGTVAAAGISQAKSEDVAMSKEEARVILTLDIKRLSDEIDVTYLRSTGNPSPFYFKGLR